MRIFYLFIFLLTVQTTSSQSSKKLEELYGILKKIEQNENLKRNEMFLLLESYEDSCLINNIEISAWRNDVIFKIINHTSNFQNMIHILKKNESFFPYILEELSSPVHEQDYNRCIENIRKTKGSKNIKKRMIFTLQQSMEP